jgi:peptidoglycan/LPS O-acetylase OafA/YrhL
MGQPAAQALALERESAHMKAEAHAAYLSVRRFPSLDGLRCLSILPVLWHHSTPGPLPGILGKGPIGVDLFFAISGFLITTLLLRERAAHGSVSLRDFYARRSLRIFPAYYAVLALYVLRGLFFLGDTPANHHFFQSLPYYATYTSNWFIDFSVPHPVIFAFAWSLATEEQFYLLWPWVLRFSKGWLSPAAFMLGLFVLDQATERGMLAWLFAPDTLAHRILSSIATPICLGALLAIVLYYRRSFRVAHALLGHRASAPAVMLAILLFLILDGVPIPWVHAALALLVGAVCIREDHGLRAILEASWARRIGAISYGMYLLHVSVITASKEVLPEPWRSAPVVFALSTGVTLLLASASYRHFEAPFLRLGDRFRGRPLT